MTAFLDMLVPLWQLPEAHPAVMPDRLRRWRIKDTMLSPWRELPGLHSRVDIWQMRLEGRFAAAEALEENINEGRNESEEGGSA